MKEMFVHKDMKVDNPKIKDLLDNWEKYVNELITFTDKRLDKMIGTVQVQLKMALEQKLFNEVDVLYLFQNMIIEARVKKNEKECETGIYEEDVKKTRRKKKKETLHYEISETSDKINDAILTESDSPEPSTKIEQLSLFDFDKT
jgi:hypothetical protein